MIKFLLSLCLSIPMFLSLLTNCSEVEEFKFKTSRKKIKNFNDLLEVIRLPNNNPASSFTTPQVIESYGYVSESHKVVTEDGYILTMHRIPFGKNEKSSPKLKRPVVFLQHGLFASSFEWFMNTPDKLLALQLSESGYDVWLGNTRGNIYCRDNINMTVKDRSFWEFSMNEMGRYDLPAEINYIIKYTGVDKINYIGYSMGTSMFFILNSFYPEFNEKIRLMIALAPVVYINNLKGFPKTLLTPFINILKPIADFIGNGEFLPPFLTFILNTVATFLCSNTFAAESFCSNLIFLFAGWDLPQTQINQLPLFFSHTPSPTSTRTLAHIAQLVNNGKFQAYDFGTSQNYFIYGTSHPPSYKLQNTKVPVALLWGPNDAVVDPIDVRRVEKEIPNLVVSMPINFNLWNHFDYHLGRDVNSLVNEPIMKLLGDFN